MRNFLKPGWRRYAVAVVVVAASLGVIGACNPTKKPPPPPPNASLLTIVPNEWSFTSWGEIKTFTVHNLGPGTSQPLRVAIFGGNISEDRLILEWRFFGLNDFCPGKRLVQGDSCTVDVESTHVADNMTSETFLNVSSDNSQQGGVAARLIATCKAAPVPCP
jgi:hypothetical protein